MKVTKEQIKEIKKLKNKKLSMLEISRKLNIPASTVQYYCDEKYKRKSLERAKKRFSKFGDTRDKERYKEYQRVYHSKRYKEDEEYREKIKQRNRENQKKNSSK